MILAAGGDLTPPYLGNNFRISRMSIFSLGLSLGGTEPEYFFHFFRMLLHQLYNYGTESEYFFIRQGKFSRNTRKCSLGIDKSQAFSADLSIFQNFVASAL